MHPKNGRPRPGVTTRSGMVVSSRGHHAGIFCRSDCRGKQPIPSSPSPSPTPPLLINLPLGISIRQPGHLVGTWLWDSFFGFHVLQFILFLGRYFLSLNIFATRLAAWLVSEHVVAVDDSYRIFNLDVRVSRPFRSPCLAPVTHPPPKVCPAHDRVGYTLRKHATLPPRPPFMASPGIRGPKRLTAALSYRDPVFGQGRHLAQPEQWSTDLLDRHRPVQVRAAILSCAHLLSDVTH